MIFGSRDPATIERPGHVDVLEDGTQVELYEGAFEYLDAHALTNEHNPILAAFRISFATRNRNDALDEWAYWWIVCLNSFDTFGGFKEWDSPVNPLHAITLANSEQIDHARRVLTRLAAVQS